MRLGRWCVALYGAAAVILATGDLVGHAGQLDSSGWSCYVDGQPLGAPGFLRVAGEAETLNRALFLNDNDPHTSILITNTARFTKQPALVISLGQTCSVTRVVITGRTNGFRTWSSSGAVPATIVASVGYSPQTMTNVGSFSIPYDARDPIDESIDIRFSPVVGSRVRLEFQTTNNLRWLLSEVELYGSPMTVATNAVVLNLGAPAPLALAANDLSYYLTELTGQPHPIIAPSATNTYVGTLYVVEDLASLAPNFTVMTNNIAKGILPTNEVNVSQSGRVVSFKGWPYRAVCWSVWEFLERQGVRWVYPDVHGDYVPATGVSLGVLPLNYRASARVIYANFEVNSFTPPGSELRQEHLYFARNRWNCSSMHEVEGLGGTEIPNLAPPGGNLVNQYKSGFGYSGNPPNPQIIYPYYDYPHNLTQVMPYNILSNNPSWWGSASGSSNYYAVQFNITQPNALTWISGKVTNWAAWQPFDCVKPLYLGPPWRAYQLLPMDAVAFSDDPVSVAANGLYGGPETTSPWVAPDYTNSSGAYYKMIATVASNCPNQIIGGLAYANVFNPPRSNYPPNVRMEVCVYGTPNLPMTSPQNAGMKAALDGWNRACSRLATYSYDLLQESATKLPVPAVAGFVGTARYLKGIGALDGGTQASVSSLPYNPWNFYAWPRSRWNTNYTAADLEGEFFTGYFKEAAAPMLAYYQVIENYQQTNNAPMHWNPPCYYYWPNPGTFPLYVLSQMYTNLVAARGSATNWYVVNRIAEISEGFDYTLATLGITNLSMLTDHSAYPIVTSSGTYTVPLASFNSAYPNQGYYYPASWNEGSNQRWSFNGAAMIYQRLNFSAAGTYRVDVVSRESYYNKGHPTLRVCLGPSHSSALVITNTALGTNSFTLTIPDATAFDFAIAQDSSGMFLQVAQVQLTRIAP